MDFREALATAKLGVPVRRDLWAFNKTMVWAAGAGTARAVLTITENNVVRVVRNTDLPAADRAARDWRQA